MAKQSNPKKVISNYADFIDYISSEKDFNIESPEKTNDSIWSLFPIDRSIISFLKQKEYIRQIEGTVYSWNMNLIYNSHDLSEEFYEYKREVVKDYYKQKKIEKYIVSELKPTEHTVSKETFNNHLIFIKRLFNTKGQILSKQQLDVLRKINNNTVISANIIYILKKMNLLLSYKKGSFKWNSDIIKFKENFVTWCLCILYDQKKLNYDQRKNKMVKTEEKNIVLTNENKKITYKNIKTPFSKKKKYIDEETKIKLTLEQQTRLIAEMAQQLGLRGESRANFITTTLKNVLLEEYSSLEV